MNTYTIIEYAIIRATPRGNEPEYEWLKSGLTLDEAEAEFDYWKIQKGEENGTKLILQKEEMTHDLYSREFISSKESIVKDYDFSTGEMNDYRIGRARP